MGRCLIKNTSFPIHSHDLLLLTIGRNQFEESSSVDIGQSKRRCSGNDAGKQPFFITAVLKTIVTKPNPF
jgi:hypothetical protein